MPAVIEVRVLELRRNRPHWGPMSLRHQLSREGVSPLPSVSGIYRALLRHGLIEPKAVRKRLPTYKRWERGRPMELWQMDWWAGCSSTTAPSAGCSPASTITPATASVPGSCSEPPDGRCAGSSPKCF
jgi:hypothetical protein